MIDYNQYDIQWRQPDDENVEENYSHLILCFNPYMMNYLIC